MKKNLLLVCAAAALAVSAQAELQVVQEERYGDSMGTTSGLTICSYMHYDESNLLMREITNSPLSGSENEWEPNYLYIYENSNGHHDRYYYLQWRAVYGEWTAAKDSTVYTYDADGNLISEILWLRTTPTEYYEEITYTWEGGNLVSAKKETVNNGNRTTSYTRTYSDFLEGFTNLPQTEVSDGQFATNQYTKKYTYDANGNVTNVMQSDAEGNPSAKEDYTYDDNGVCTLKITYSYSNGEYVNKSKIERTAKGNLSYERREYSYSNSLEDWNWSGMYFVEYYAEVDGTTAPRNLVVANTSTAESPVAVSITADVPSNAPVGAKYVIWREWNPIATVEAVDGKISYLDTTAANGTHSYFVQTVVEGEGVTTRYNSTTPVQVDVEVSLAPVTNIRFLGGYQGTYDDPQSGSYPTYYVKLAWDAPATDFEVLRYELYEEGFAFRTAEIEGTATSYDLSVASGNSITFRIDAVYEYGTATGEYVTINFDRTVNMDAEVSYEMTKRETYGDAMGRTDLAGIEQYLYDGNNNIIRAYDLGRGYDGVITPNKRTYYFYDENGNMVESYYNQYTATAGTWNENKREHYIYTYDEDGNLISKVDQAYGDRYDYTYSGGVLESETYTVGGNVMWTKTYIGMGGAPMMMESVGRYETYSFSEYYTYDEAGRILTIEATYTSDNRPKDKTEYAYDERGIVTEKTYYVGKDSEYVASSRETRQYLGDGCYEMTTETYYEGEWSPSNVSYKEYYAYINNTSAPRNLKVADVSTADAPNSIEVTCDLPVSPIQNAGYVVYRGWQAVDTVAAGTTTVAFTDLLVPNGSYDYTVQSIDTVTGLLYNCATPVEIEVATVLPEVVNLRQIGKSEGVYRDPNIGMELPAYWLIFSWEAPETDMEIVAYNIYQDGQILPTTVHTDMDVLTDSVWVYREDYPEYQQTESNIVVKAVYAIGESEGVEAVLTVEYSGVDEVVATKAYVAGDYLYVGTPAVVNIYNAGGMLVNETRNSERVSLAGLTKGVYVARIAVGSQVQVVKIIR